MAIRSISHVHITKIVSVRTFDSLVGLPLLNPQPSDVSLSYVCLEIGKACRVFKEGAAFGYGGRVVEVSKKPKIFTHFFNFSSLSYYPKLTSII
jgi:hypothetical protein